MSVKLPVPVIEADGSSERQFVSTRLKCTMSLTGFPALSNVVIPETSIDPSHTSSNAPHDAEPEYVNESVNLSGGVAEAAPASSSATPHVAAADARSPFMPFLFSPPGSPQRTSTMSRD